MYYTKMEAKVMGIHFRLLKIAASPDFRWLGRQAETLAEKFFIDAIENRGCYECAKYY